MENAFSPFHFPLSPFPPEPVAQSVEQRTFKRKWRFTKIAEKAEISRLKSDFSRSQERPQKAKKSCVRVSLTPADPATKGIVAQQYFAPTSRCPAQHPPPAPAPAPSPASGYQASSRRARTFFRTAQPTVCFIRTARPCSWAMIRCVSLRQLGAGAAVDLQGIVERHVVLVERSRGNAPGPFRKATSGPLGSLLPVRRADEKGKSRVLKTPPVGTSVSPPRGAGRPLIARRQASLAAGRRGPNRRLGMWPLFATTDAEIILAP